jgi:AraC-like DNA-binding protein
MTDFLIDPIRLKSDSEPVLLIARRDQTEERHTKRHRHARGQLLGTLKGLVSIDTDQGRWLVPPINAVWIPPHTLHGLKSQGEFHGWSVYVAEANCMTLPSVPRVLRLSGLLHEAVVRAATWPEGNRSTAQDHISSVILDEIALAPEEPLGLPMPADLRLQKIAREMANFPAKRQRMEDWAAWAGIAPRSLSRRFVLETGLTFSTWRHRAILLRSLEMLAAKNSVTTIAFSLGYETVSAFIDLFRGHFGITPARFLKRFAE